MFRLFFPLLLCVCNTAFAELKLQINLPEKGVVNQPLKIDLIGSEAKVMAWIMPDLQGGTVFGCDCDGQSAEKEFMFFPSKPGRYVFALHGTDGEKLAYTSKVLTITGTATPPPVDPVNPPVNDFESLRKQSFDLSNSLNDQQTRSQLYQNLSQDSFGDTLASSQTNLELIVTKVLSMRSRDKQDADWYNGWYRPILKEIKSLADTGKITNLDGYNKAVKSAIFGLK
jgi:hypothetical protein